MKVPPLNNQLYISGGLKPALWDPNFRSQLPLWLSTYICFGRVEISNSSMDYYGQQKITDKVYNEAKMRTQQKQEIPSESNTTTGILKQKRAIIWAPLDPETDIKVSGPDHLNEQYLSRGHHRVWTPTHRHEIKEASKVVNHEACRLFHDINVIPIRL